MSDLYRVRYRYGDLEVEVESTDKKYVDDKLDSLVKLKPSTPPPSPKKPKKPPKAKPNQSSSSQTVKSGEEPTVDIMGLIGFIKDSDEYPQIEEKVLNKKGQLPRIMMVLYFNNDFSDDAHLTTGQIETITDQLGVRIQSQNGGKVIKRYQKYFTAKAVRKMGAIVPYKLNRQGLRAFEGYLDGKKL